MLTRFIVCTIVFLVLAGYTIWLCERPTTSREKATSALTILILSALGGLVISVFQT